MTSRVSFYKLYKENLKRHFTSLLILVLAFVVHLITIIMTLQNYVEIINEQNLDHYLERILSLFSPNLANGIFALGAGLFLAFDFFRYLHSKMQTDFYESLPVRKADLFLTNIVCAISSFVILSIVTFALELLVVNLFGYGSISVLKNILWNLLCTNLCFIASFLTGVLAWVMTGHPIVALLGYSAFMGYVPVLLYNLFPTFASAYFDTYIRMPVFTKTNWNNLFYFLSPGSLMTGLCMETHDMWTLKNHVSFFIAIIVFSAIIGYLAFFLYKKRPGETAGRAMAFEKLNAPIRILVVIPIALYAGLLLQELSSNTLSIGWLIFGIIFVGFIMHGLMEAIFEADVRAAFRKKKQLLLSYGICFAFLSIFWFDIFNYDDFLPKENKVESVHIEVDNFREFDYLIDKSDGLTGSYVKPALDSASELIASNKNTFTDSVGVTFIYELKNGTSIYRQYRMDIHNVPKTLDQLSETDAFKDDVCILYHFDKENFVNIYTQSNYTDMPLDAAYIDEIFESYLEEYKEMSLSDFYHTLVECQLIGEFADDREYRGESYTETVYYTNHWFPVYTTFDQTISLLKKAGYVPFIEKDDITFTLLDIHSEKDTNPITIDDPVILKQLKPYIRLNDYNYYFSNPDWYHGTLQVQSSYDELYLDVLIKKDNFHAIVK